MESNVLGSYPHFKKEKASGYFLPINVTSWLIGFWERVLYLKVSYLPTLSGYIAAAISEHMPPSDDPTLACNCKQQNKCTQITKTITSVFRGNEASLFNSTQNPFAFTSQFKYNLSSTCMLRTTSV